MEHESRLLNYPDKLSNNDKFQSDAYSDEDLYHMMASWLIEKGYPVPSQDVYRMTEHIREKNKCQT